MSEQAAAYRIVQRNHVSQWSTELNRAVDGWNVLALWLSTRTVLPVFVPDDRYTPENVDALIRAAGATDEAIHKLGA